VGTKKEADSSRQKDTIPAFVTPIKLVVVDDSAKNSNLSAKNTANLLELFYCELVTSALQWMARNP
jgi:hypothetical protein